VGSSSVDGKDTKQGKYKYHLGVNLRRLGKLEESI